MSQAKPLCQIEDIPDGGALEVHAESATGGFSLVLLRQGQVVQAFHNSCPHAGRALNWAPGKFLIDKGTLVCAAHGAVFAMDTGGCLGGPCRGQALHRVPVRVEAGAVWSR